MGLAGIGGAAWGFLKRIPDWVLWAIAAIVLFKFVDFSAERRGSQKQKSRDRIANAEEHARTIKTSHEVGREIRDAKDAAIAAPESVPDVSSADELRIERPDIASVILSDRSRHGSGS